MTEEWEIVSDLTPSEQREAAGLFLRQAEEHPEDARWQTVAACCRAILGQEVQA